MFCKKIWYRKCSSKLLLTTNDIQYLFPIFVKVKKTFKLVRKIFIKFKSPRSGGIYTALWQRAEEAVIRPLTRIVRASLTYGQILKAWRGNSVVYGIYLVYHLYLKWSINNTSAAMIEAALKIHEAPGRSESGYTTCWSDNRCQSPEGMYSDVMVPTGYVT